MNVNTYRKRMESINVFIVIACDIQQQMSAKKKICMQSKIYNTLVGKDNMGSLESVEFTLWGLCMFHNIEFIVPCMLAKESENGY